MVVPVDANLTSCVLSNIDGMKLLVSLTTTFTTVVLVGSSDAVNVNETLLAELTLTAVAESAAIDILGRVAEAKLLLYKLRGNTII